MYILPQILEYSTLIIDRDQLRRFFVKCCLVEMIIVVFGNVLLSQKYKIYNFRDISELIKPYSALIRIFNGIYYLYSEFLTYSLWVIMELH